MPSFGIVYASIAVKMVVAEGLVLKAVDIDGDDMHIEMALIEQVLSVVHPVALTNLLQWTQDY